jgi:hypothetical protein
MPGDDDLRIAFSLCGFAGLVAVYVTRNTDPQAIGYSLLGGGSRPILRGGSRCAGPRWPTRPGGMLPCSAGRSWSAQPTAHMTPLTARP